MLDLALTAFVLGFMALGLRRPFVWVLAYIYIDIVSPQKISYFLLASIPISLIAFVAAFGGWLLIDDKTGTRFTARQGLILLLLGYCGLTTLTADFPEAALTKWAWVWKSLVFALFLPLTLRTRLRTEAVALVMVLSAAAITISGGIKTLFSGGGGYGSLSFLVSDNTGIYEGSTLSMVAIAVIPVAAWLARHGTIFPPGKAVKLFAAGVIFSCLLIPIGSQTRTGLLCIGVLALLVLRTARHRFLYAGLFGAAALIAIPFLPASYTERMGTIENHQADQSASTRVAVWMWTLDYVQDNPLGGGFDSFLGNHITVSMRDVETDGATTSVETEQTTDKARAFHSAYFEVLGEQGYPGFLIWALFHLAGLWRTEALRRQLKRSSDPRDQADGALATALQQSHVVYLVGALFIGVAYQPFIYLLIALQIGLDVQVRRRQPKPVIHRLAPGALKPA